MTTEPGRMPPLAFSSPQWNLEPELIHGLHPSVRIAESHIHRIASSMRGHAQLMAKMRHLYSMYEAGTIPPMLLTDPDSQDSSAGSSSNAEAHLQILKKRFEEYLVQEDKKLSEMAQQIDSLMVNMFDDIADFGSHFGHMWDRNELTHEDGPVVQYIKPLILTKINDMHEKEARTHVIKADKARKHAILQKEKKEKAKEEAEKAKILEEKNITPDILAILQDLVAKAKREAEPITPESNPPKKPQPGRKRGRRNSNNAKRSSPQTPTPRTGTKIRTLSGNKRQRV